MLVSQHPDLGNLGSWEETLQRGSPRLFLWVAPLRWATLKMNSHHLPWLSAPCDSWSSSELLGSFLYLSPRLIPPSCWPRMSRSELGKWDSSKDLGRNQRQGSGDIDHQSWEIFQRWIMCFKEGTPQFVFKIQEWAEMKGLPKLFPWTEQVGCMFILCTEDLK